MKNVLILGGGTVGTMVANLVGGWVTDVFDWRTAFFVVGLPGLLVALVFIPLCVYLTMSDDPAGGRARTGPLGRVRARIVCGAANNQLEEIAAFLEGELATATTAMKDGRPLEISNYLAFHFMPKLYAHHMDYAMTLLQNEDVTKFNSLRNTTHFLTFTISVGVSDLGANAARIEDFLNRFPTAG